MIETRDSALSHIRVLELGALPASYAGHFLADLGADVIKIEPPGGDRTRMDSPFLGDIAGPDRSLAFVHINANKRSIMLDFAKAADRRVFADLVETADAVVEACPVGYLGSLNLGYEHLKAANPAITLISLTPFGQVGPLRQFKGNNGIAEAMGGVIFPLGDDTRAPCVSPNDFLTQIAGVHGASSTLAAIYNRRQGGGGQQVDISSEDVGPQVQRGLPECGLRRW